MHCQEKTYTEGKFMINEKPIDKDNIPLGKRFFFTASEESTSWIAEQCFDVGLQPPELIRLIVHSAMRRAKAGDKTIITL